MRSLPAKPVDLATDGTRATLKCGSATFTLVLLPEEEYPTLPDMPPLTGSVGSDALASAISQVAIAAGRDDTLPALTGIRIEISGDRLTLVATDRYRLAVRELRWNPAQPDLSTAVLVPARVLGDTARALTSGAEVSISLGGDSLIGFAGAGRQTTTRLLSGEYPKYQSLLPSEFSATAELPAAPFAEAVKRVALVAERNTPVRLAFSAGQLVLEAGASEDAQAVEVLEAAFDGEDLQIAFNPQYLLDGIGAIDSDMARTRSPRPPSPPSSRARAIQAPTTATSSCPSVPQASCARCRGGEPGGWSYLGHYLRRRQVRGGRTTSASRAVTSHPTSKAPERRYCCSLARRRCS